MEDEDERIDLNCEDEDEGENWVQKEWKRDSRVWSRIQKLNEEITFLPPMRLFYEVNLSLNLNHKIIKYVWSRFGYRVIMWFGGCDMITCDHIITNIYGDNLITHMVIT